MSPKTKSHSGNVIAVGCDIGAGYSAVSVMIDGKLHWLKFDLDGDEFASVVWIDTDGTVYIGKEALNRAYKNPSSLYMNFKPELFDRPNEPVNGGPTRVELTAHLIRFAVAALLKKFPDLKEFPQFGGTTRPANELVLAFSVPATFGLEQHATMRSAIRLAGVNVDVGKLAFPSEPKSAARRMAHEHGRHLNDDEKLAIEDLGHGSFDIIIVRYKNGVFHEVTAPFGDNFLGGRLFTACLASEICTALKAKCQSAFSAEKGLLLEEVKEESERELAISIWLAADEAKVKLSTCDRVSVFVQTPKGKREVQLTQEQAQNAWAPLWQRMETALCTGMSEAGISWSEIAEVFLVGGAAGTSTLRERVATWTGRKESDVRMSSDSSHVVANGNAEEAFFGEKSDQVAVDPFGVRMLDEQRNYVNRVLTRRGQVIPANGLLLEHFGQAIRSPGGATQLLLEPFIAKPGVRCADPCLGLPVTLSDQEIIPLKRLKPTIELPTGLHDMRLTVQIDPLRSTNLVFTPLNLPHVEPICVPLEMEEGVPDDGPISLADMVFVPIVDCSASMSKGGKIGSAKAALSDFIDQMEHYEPRFGLVRMNDDVKLVCPLTKDLDQCRDRLDEMDAGGGTLMTESLALTETILKGIEKTSAKFVILFSDGLPKCASSAIAQAERLKKLATVICVGIGHDASPVLLKQISSTEDDYYFARMPDDLFVICNRIAEVIHRNHGQND